MSSKLTLEISFSLGWAAMSFGPRNMSLFFKPHKFSFIIRGFSYTVLGQNSTFSLWVIYWLKYVTLISWTLRLYVTIHVFAQFMWTVFIKILCKLIPVDGTLLHKQIMRSSNTEIYQLHHQSVGKSKYRHSFGILKLFWWKENIVT